MNWLVLETIDAPTGGWQRQLVVLQQLFGEPADQVVLRFNACDTGGGSYLEAGVDDVSFLEVR